MLHELDIDGSYTQDDNPLVKFYGPCISNSKNYLRAAGYFRSSFLNLIPQYLTDFIHNGGVIKILCSPHLESKDIDIIYKSNLERQELINSEVDSILEDLTKMNKDKIFASLIKFGNLDINIVFKKNGLFHEKWGIFEDGILNKVYFSGSINETYSAWNPNINFENLETRCSWKSKEDNSIIEKRTKYFFQLWNNEANNVIVEKISRETISKIKKYAYDTKDELVYELRKTAESVNYNTKTNLGSLSKNLERDIDLKLNARPHQIKAFDSWLKNKQIALLKHCTGSGKTYTGIMTLQHHFQENNFAIIIVPSEILLKQWFNDIKKFLGNVDVILCGANNNLWKKMSNFQLINSNKKVAFISVIDTAASVNFSNLFLGVRNIHLIVDEVHTIGAKSYLKIMDNLNHVHSRLGISATPERQDEGYSRITKFFGQIIDECVYEIRDGISDGYLCKYEYYNLVVDLDEDEKRQWDSITKKILFSSKDTKEDSKKENLDKLIFMRSLIAQNSKNKIPKAIEIIRNNYDPDKDSFLVFCIHEEQLIQLAAELNALNIAYMIYHSGLSSDVRDETLKSFSKNGGLILSIKCLDEGVDIPTSSKALILASSQNTRQFVQRRGRVLRVSDNKKYAVIYDILIDIDVEKKNSYFEKEIYRAWVFAKDSENYIEIKTNLELLCFQHKTNLDNIIIKYNKNVNVDNTEIEIENV